MSLALRAPARCAFERPFSGERPTRENPICEIAFNLSAMLNLPAQRPGADRRRDGRACTLERHSARPLSRRASVGSTACITSGQPKLAASAPPRFLPSGECNGSALPFIYNFLFFSELYLVFQAAW